MISMLANLLMFVVPFVMVLTVVVTVHELGHFWVAKACGVAIDRFSIGFGRPIWSRRDRSGVEWRIGWIPLGGYVRFAGDENAASVPDHEDLEELRRHIVRTEGVDAVTRYFHFKPLWQRAAVVVAGPLANFILAIAIFAALLLAAGEDVLPARVGEVDAGSPAAVAGFRPGDLIVEANGRRVDSFQDVAEAAVLRVGLPTEYAVERAGARVELTAVSALRVRPDPLGMMRKQGTLGIHPVQGPDAWVHMTYNPLQAVEAGVHRTGRIISTTVYYLGRMVRGQVSADQLNGPLGIANTTRAVTAQAAHAPTFGGMVIMAVGGLVSLAGFISVGVGFMNLLPVPVLDGGHLLFYAYEAVARRPLAAQVQAAGYRVGLALVLGLMLFATWNDLQQLSVFKNLGRLFL